MRFPLPLRFLRRKATRCALLAGLLTAAACWWVMPPAPLFSIKVTEESSIPVFSQGMRYLAASTFDHRGVTVETTLWDIQTGLSLCTFRLPASCVQAFTEDETTFVDFWRGKAQFRDVVTGQTREINGPVAFPHEEDIGKETKSWLIADPRGRLLVLVKEKDYPWSVRDLETGKEVDSFYGQPNLTYFGGFEPKLKFHFLLPSLMIISNPKEMVVEGPYIPSGIKQIQIIDDSSFFLSSLKQKITPDGKTRVEVDGKVHVYDRMGRHRELNLVGHFFPVLSFDGRYLLVIREKTNNDHHPWLGWFLEWFRNRNSLNNTVFYDLEQEIEIATFTDAQGGLFSLDKGRIAVYGTGSLDIYDLPLKKPWAKIVGYALSVAGGVFLVGLFCGFFRNKLGSTRKVG